MGGGLRDKSFVQGGRGDCLKSVGSHKVEVKDLKLKDGGGEVNVVGEGGGSSAWRLDSGQEVEEAEANPEGR